MPTFIFGASYPDIDQMIFSPFHNLKFLKSSVGGELFHSKRKCGFIGFQRTLLLVME